MSAYVVVELEVLDTEAKATYSKAAGPIVRSFGGEFIAGGEWELLAGSADLSVGIIIRFPDRCRALEWYQSNEYQALIAGRAKAMICRFRLLG